MTPGSPILRAALSLLATLTALALAAPAAAETVVFGPATVVRTTGSPQTFTASFELSVLDVPYFLRVGNGDAGGGHRVSSAEVRVNGVAVVSQQDLNQQVAGLVVPLAGLAAANTLEARLGSMPGSFLVLEVFTPEDILGPPSPPVLDPHAASTTATTITLTGRAPGANRVEVVGPAAVLTVAVTSGAFQAPVPLKENSVNLLTLTALNARDVRSAATTTQVIHDAEAPSLFIDFPPAAAQLTLAAVDVVGRVGDMLSGFMGLTVTVNGVPAEVNVGIGNNGTFLAPAVPLLAGQPTTLTATATDELGNETTRQVTVTRIEIPPDSPRLEVLSGNGQSAEIDTLLPQPVVVRVTRADGSPFADKLVTFDVVRSNGRLTTDGGEDGTLTLQVRTDAQGEARAFWRVGSDAGSGNNRLEVKANGVVGSAFLCATALAGVPDQINVGTGNNQRGEAGGPAREPLVAWVNDGCNGAPGVPVTFRVVRGGGTVDGASEVTVVSGLTGHASVRLTLGPEAGNNVVEASFPGNPGAPAEFVASGLRRDENQPTTFSGLVVDNANRPIQGAKCTLVVNGVTVPPTFTDAAGQFLLTDVPAGAAHLHVDGLVATALNGQPIAPGTFPALAYEMQVVPNAANSLPTPVLLPVLNPHNAVVFDNTHDVELTVEEIAGLKMLVKAGSMRRADGTVPSPADPAVLALNQVHHDDVPMPMPDGAAPPFAWTLQPGGAHFDPPVKVTYPNMSGLPAGAIAFFLSFNHDTGRFEIVASGSVSRDGSEIVTDPGAGISTAGWGCNCPPYAVTSTCTSCTVTAVLGDKDIDAGATEGVQCVITNTSTGTCNFNWTVTKTSGTPTVNPNPPSGSLTLGPGAAANTPLQMTVPANSAARDHAVMTLNVTGDASASDTGNICVLPADETSAFLGWFGGAGQDVAMFSGTLTPATADFNTRTVTENPVGSGTNTTDSCWFAGSALPQYTNANSISGGTWTVGAGNVWQTDHIGFFADIDGYYSAQGRTPCAMHTEQHMKINCPSGNVEYTVNAFDINVQAGGTIVSRDGVAATSAH